MKKQILLSNINDVVEHYDQNSELVDFFKFLYNLVDTKLTTDDLL